MEKTQLAKGKEFSMEKGKVTAWITESGKDDHTVQKEIYFKYYYPNAWNNF